MSGKKNFPVSLLKDLGLAAGIFETEMRRTFVSFSIFTLESNFHHPKSFLVQFFSQKNKCREVFFFFFFLITLFGLWVRTKCSLNGF